MSGCSRPQAQQVRVDLIKPHHQRCNSNSRCLHDRDVCSDGNIPILRFQMQNDIWCGRRAQQEGLGWFRQGRLSFEIRCIFDSGDDSRHKLITIIRRAKRERRNVLTILNIDAKNLKVRGIRCIDRWRQTKLLPKMTQNLIFHRKPHGFLIR